MQLPLLYQERARMRLDHRQPFGDHPRSVAYFMGRPPKEEQHILRMMIRHPASGDRLFLPKQMQWLESTIYMLDEYQRERFVSHPFVYVTIRHGIVKSVTDDEWHVDGFSMRIEHPPEQNYICATDYPTEILDRRLLLPGDFDPLRHNIHHYFQDFHSDAPHYSLDPYKIYLIDPYVIHRRPSVPAGTWRTFWRVSFVPIEIEDDTCMPNPLMHQRRYNSKDFRHSLVRYPG